MNQVAGGDSTKVSKACKKRRKTWRTKGLIQHIMPYHVLPLEAGDMVGQDAMRIRICHVHLLTVLTRQEQHPLDYTFTSVAQASFLEE